MSNDKERSRIWAANRRKKSIAEGLCPACHKVKLEEDYEYNTCPSCRVRHRAYGKKKNAKQKQEMFDHYGHVCSCCGEVNEKFLTIDHVNNDGSSHRAEIGRGPSYTYQWAKKNNWPDTLTTLCWNCNIGKYFNGGVCPHKEEQ